MAAIPVLYRRQRSRMGPHPWNHILVRQTFDLVPQDDLRFRPTKILRTGSQVVIADGPRGRRRRHQNQDRHRLSPTDPTHVGRRLPAGQPKSDQHQRQQGAPRDQLPGPWEDMGEK